MYESSPSSPRSSSPETQIKAEALRPGVESVRANTYVTKRVIDIRLGDQPPQKWHLVKGGIRNETTLPEGHTPTYEIYYNPDTNQWLKLVPSVGRDIDIKDLERRLDEGTTVVQGSLRISNLPEIAEQISFLKDAITLPNGQRVSGQISPHIGFSLEQILLDEVKTSKPNAAQAENLSIETRARLAEYYQAAFNIALRLYLQHGYYTDDPNPGNILVAEDAQGNPRVALIDFAGKRPIRDYLQRRNIPDLEQIPELEREGKRDGFRRRLHNKLLTEISGMYVPFQNHCDRLRLTADDLGESRFFFDATTNNQALQEYIMGIVDSRFPLPTEQATPKQNSADSENNHE